MKLHTKVLAPIIGVLILSFTVMSFVSVRYSDVAAGNVMRLMSDLHIRQAKTLAYMIEQDPGLLDYDTGGFSYRLAEIARTMGVDEVHVTDQNGVIRWGNVQEFYGFDFHASEQTRELLPVLTNHEVIAQEPRPRGIDGVMFQYISVPRLDQPGIVQVGVSMKSVMELRDSMDYRSVILVAGILSALLVTMIIVWLISVILSKPLRKLASTVAQFGSGDLEVRADLRTSDELGVLATAFDRMAVDLKEYVADLATVTAEKERIRAELDVATKIQSAMLPCIFPAFPDRVEFDLYASMEPANEVGGDFYDFFMIDDNTLAMVMADVSGKGVPAALFMVIAKTLIKNTAQSGQSPTEVLGLVNNLLCENNEADMFVTVILGYLDIATGELTLVNAGHNPALLRCGERFDWLEARPNFVLAGLEDVAYQECSLRLKPGDELFLYTDGITEAVNNDNDLFGEARLLEAANHYRDLPLRQFTVSIGREVSHFAEGAEQQDDITMLMLRYKGGGDG